MCKEKAGAAFILLFIGITFLILNIDLRVPAQVIETQPPEPVTTQVIIHKTETAEAVRGVLRTTKDYQDLCRIVEAEAAGEGYEGKRAVAEVVLNRVAAEGFGDTIHEVIYAPGQFARPADREITAETRSAVEEAIREQKIDALYFMNPDKADPAARSWMESLTYVTTIGNHDFYK